jgi:hypothetical protein
MRLRLFTPWTLATISIALLVTMFSSMRADPASAAVSTLTHMANESATPELALLMGDLQRLTHKLALSADAGNAELAAFYLHESQEQLRKIQSEAPEYENLPIALLIDRLAHPAYAPMQEVVIAQDAKRMRVGIHGIILLILQV